MYASSVAASYENQVTRDLEIMTYVSSSVYTYNTVILLWKI
jgi:hypothetical protein